MSDQDYAINSEFQENYRYSKEFWAPFINDAQIYTLAGAGYTWSDIELKELSKEGREPVELNIMRRPLQFYSGYLRDNLNSIVVEPVEGSDQKTADQFTKLSSYVWDKGGGYNTFLDSCDEGLKSGMSLCGLYMDYRKDFINGEIGFYKRTYNSFYLDPTFEKIDLSDCAFTIMRDVVDKKIVKQLLPFVDQQVIDEMQTSFRDEKFLNYHPNFGSLSKNRNLVAYDQYYRKVSQNRKFLVDEKAGYFRDITDLDEEEEKKLERGIRRIRKLHDEAMNMGVQTSDLPPLIEIRTQEREMVELCIMLNGQKVYQGKDKTGIEETYPFVPNLCYLEPSIWMPSKRVQGIASTLWSAQRQFNKRHMKIIDMMDSTISTGFKYLIGSVSDPKDLQQTGQNKLIGIDPENAPEGLNSVQELAGGQANPSLVEYQKILDELTLTLANVNESVLGVDEGGNTQVSGRLAQVRIAQGLRSNRKVFDNIEVSQEILAGLVLKVIQNNYSPEKVKRILGEEPTKQFYEKDFEQYDAVLREGVRSKSQRDAYYYELVNLKREGIVDVPQEEITRMLPITGKSDLDEAIESKQQQDAQIAQEQMRLEMEKMQAEVDNLKAHAKERNTRADSNEGLLTERESEALQNTAQAVLDRAKAITELSKVKEEHLMNVLSYLRGLEAEENQKFAQIAQELQNRSDEEDPDTKRAQKELDAVSSQANVPEE